MKNKRTFCLLLRLFFVVLFFSFALAASISSFAGTANYFYDDGNRLVRVEYEDGSMVEYGCDESGNRIQKHVQLVDTTAPITTAVPAGGTYPSAQSVVLSCDDGAGSGCDRIFYTMDNSDPIVSSFVYTAPIAIVSTTTLKFFAKDFKGNAEGVKSQTYTIATDNQLLVTVRKGDQNAMAGVRVYLFSEGGVYLGQGKTTDAAGNMVFTALPGTYKVRVDYLGYVYWSQPVQLTTSANIDVTIPHQAVNVTVNGIYQGTATPVSGARVYLFSPAGSYLGQSGTTSSDGRMAFSLPAQDYKVRVDYLGCQYFSSVFNAQDAIVNLPMANGEITVTSGSRNLSGVRIYTFSVSGAYLGISGTTNASGQAGFSLPAGNYDFRADFLGNQYWSRTSILTADQNNAVTINTGGGTFTLKVLSGGTDPLRSVACYAFNAAGTYLGLSGKTDENGQVIYNLPDGSYKFRIGYLGSQFWTDVITMPTTMNLTRTIVHRSITITVRGLLSGNEQVKSGTRVYLFNPAGTYLNHSAITDGSGRATFSLPEEPFKVRADYLGKPFWSGVFTAQDADIVIPEGTGRIHVTSAGQSVPGVSVYVFSPEGSYLNMNGSSDASGNVVFRLPTGNYKFRADYQGNQYWTTATIAQDGTNVAEVDTGGGRFTLTLNTGSEPMTGVKVYVFNAAGTYLGLSAASNALGQAVFSLAEGSFKFRVDYLGYQFWTDVYPVPTALAADFPIPHQNASISVEKVYLDAQPLSAAKVYLFTPSGTYLDKIQVTNTSGQAVFSLPNKGYKVRVDYLGGQYWSDEFRLQNAVVSIPQGMAQLSLKKAGAPIADVPVYAFNESGSYLGLNARSNNEGQVELILPGKNYKFRADEGGAQHWSPVTSIAVGQVNFLEMSW